MTIFTKSNGLTVILSCICMLLLVLNYVGYKYESIPVRKLNIRKIQKYVNHYNNISAYNASIVSKNHQHTLNASVISINNTLATNTNTLPQNTVPPATNSFEASSSLDFRITKAWNQYTTAKSLPDCSTRVVEGGTITPNTTLEPLDVVEYELGPYLKPGGYFQPRNCISKHHVAIVVPFRDRYAHLSIFLRNIHPFLMRQHITYRIFIVEQTNGQKFNRAALMNIGFLEALKIFQWDCFIFHDVDLLPLDNRNLYNCPRQPRHMSVAIDSLKFKLPYKTIFGGVSAMTRKHFQLVNGFSNSYFGWGGEDDDMANRLKHANLYISRYPINIGRYLMLKHQKDKPNPNRYENLINGLGKIEMDGINSIKYEIYSIKEFPTFTWYLAELKIPNQKSS